MKSYYKSATTDKELTVHHNTIPITPMKHNNTFSPGLSTSSLSKAETIYISTHTMMNRNADF